MTVKLSPVLKDYLWGGTKLRSLYGKKSDAEKIAESWELAAHKDGNSMIASGSMAGETLSDYIMNMGRGCLGTKAKSDELPIMIKFIDAKNDLSIQVHPDDVYARKSEADNGKTEMWMVLESEPDAYIYIGVEREVSREEMETTLKGGTLLGLLKKVPVKKGDVFFIPAGTIHAIGKGIVICEIQQNSNITYRLYDFDRKDAFGNKRPLHIDRALDVAARKPFDINAAPELVLASTENMNISLLRSCPYFSVYRYLLDGELLFRVGIESFATFICLEGRAELFGKENELGISKGETVFIPAGNEEYKISGKVEFLLVRL